MTDEVIVTAGNRLGRKAPNLVVCGLDEREILDMAPAMTCDRVHWDTVEEFSARDLVGDLGMPAWTRQWSDGQHRVWVEAGRGYEARERIGAWCLEHEVETVNMRVEPNVPFRDLDAVPAPYIPELIGAAVEWLYPRTHAIRAQVAANLELVEVEDVRSMMYLFISDHLDRFDTQREGRNGTLNLLAFLFGKLRTWPQDAARAAFGRTVVADRLSLSRAADAAAATEFRPATEAERAAALRTTVSDLRRREQAISTLSNLRNYQSLTPDPDDQPGYDGPQLASHDDVESRGTQRVRNAELTRAIMSAVNDPASSARRAQDPLALAAVYLSFWEELSRPEVARELTVLPKTAAAAVNRVLEQVEQSDVL